MQQRGQGSSSKSNPKKFKLLQKGRDASEPSAAAGHSGHILGVRRFARALARGIGISAEGSKVWQALQESEEFSSSLLGNSPFPIIVINPDTSVKYVNPALEKLTGFTSEELTDRKAPYPWWTEETLQKTEKDLGEAMRKGAQKLEELFQTKNGDRFWVEITSRPVKKNGKLKYCLANWVDITERKRAEEALRESEERYKDIVENAGVAICADDKNGNITYFNQEFADLFGYSIEEMKKQSHKTLLHLDDLRIVSEFHKRRMQGEKEPSRYEFKGLKKDGSVIHLEVVIGSILTKGGGIIGIRNYFWDITERKRVEKILQEHYEKREELERILNRTPAVVFLWKAAEGWPVEFVSDNVDQFGYKPQEFHSGEVPYDKIIHPDDLDRVAAEAAQYNNQEIYDSFTQEYRVVTKTGEVRWVDDRTWIKRDKDGLITHHQGIIVDITDHKRAEEALQEERDKAQKYLDIAEVMFIAIDIEGNVTLINKKGCKVLGYGESEVIGKNWFDNFLPERLRDTVKPISEKLLAGELEIAEYFENPVLTKSGEERLIVWHNTTLQDESGNIIGHLSSGEDITDRKGAEDALKQTTEELKTEREELTEMNLVFKHVIEHIEQERQEYKQKICQDVEQAAIPVLTRLKEKIGPAHADEFEALQATLKTILARDVDKFREQYAKLTPREMEICEMIKEGLSSKEIADSLNLSVLTIHKHREEIRRKLGITNKAVNLGTYLRTR